MGGDYEINRHKHEGCAIRWGIRSYQKKRKQTAREATELDGC